jgi:hypothetical protein
MSEENEDTAKAWPWRHADHLRREEARVMVQQFEGRPISEALSVLDHAKRIILEESAVRRSSQQ